MTLEALEQSVRYVEKLGEDLFKIRCLLSLLDAANWNQWVLCPHQVVLCVCVCVCVCACVCACVHVCVCVCVFEHTEN